MKALLPILAICTLPACTPTATDASEDLVQIEVENQTPQVLTGFSVYPLRDDGTIVDDNLGGAYDPLAPGARHQQTISLLACGKVMVIASLADGAERRVPGDLCQSPRVIIQP